MWTTNEYCSSIPTVDNVEEAYSLYRDNDCNCLIAAGVCTAQQTHKEAAEMFINAIKELNHKMGIPQKIEGIKAEDIPTMARNAEKEANPLYPVPMLMTAEELESFYFKIADWS